MKKLVSALKLYCSQVPDCNLHEDIRRDRETTDRHFWLSTITGFTGTSHTWVRRFINQALTPSSLRACTLKLI